MMHRDLNAMANLYSSFRKFSSRGSRSPKFLLDKRICAGCDGTIEKEITLKIEPNIFLHSDCLVCYQCGFSLAAEDSCFVKFGRIFCYNHYRALFSMSCSICQNELKTTDLVLPLCQDNYCHAQCLLCTVCGKNLTAGCKYTISNWSVVCADCTLPTTLPSFSTLSNQSFYSNRSHTTDTNRNSVNIDSDNQGSSGKLDTSLSSDDEDDYSDSQNEDSGSDVLVNSTRSSPTKPEGYKKTKKPPRNRTVLSEKQLGTLQTYYQMNPKPDAMTKEQLMEKTGLNQRVISVWFQNKRCKEKKRRISDELNKSKCPGMLATAELMLTESPIEYEPQIPGGIEIEKLYNESNRFLKESNYIKNYFTTILSDQKPDQSGSSNRCLAPLAHSVSTHNQFSNTARLH